MPLSEPGALPYVSSETVHDWPLPAAADGKPLIAHAPLPNFHPWSQIWAVAKRAVILSLQPSTQVQGMRNTCIIVQSRRRPLHMLSPLRAGGGGGHTAAVGRRSDALTQLGSQL